MFDRDGDGFIDPVPENWQEYGGGGCGCLIAIIVVVVVVVVFVL